jgi:serine/threonine protein phosphatase 1
MGTSSHHVPLHYVTRHLAIGDIHGCINALTTLLGLVGLRPDDTIITLGDYVDRGPDASAVLNLIIELDNSHHLVPLRGNHEIMMLDAHEKASWLKPWLSYGGEATLHSYSGSQDTGGSFDDVPEAHLDFLRNRLLPWYECATHFFVHAFADADTALEDQTDPNLYWRKYINPKRHCSGRIMVCGHTPQKTGVPLVNDHSICIDTWAYGDGWLSCLEVESGIIRQANESGDTRSFTIHETDHF